VELDRVDQEQDVVLLAWVPVSTERILHFDNESITQK